MSVIKPNFLGIGGMKCGSTWVSECLRYHPEVFMSSPKELHFFSSKQYWDRGPDWYFAHFEQAVGHKAIGEFSPSYVRSTQTTPETMIERIHDLLGDVRIVVALRNPIDRYVSNLKHFIREGHVPAGESLTPEIFDELNRRHPSLLLFGLLTEVVHKFQESFGAERVHVMSMERCKQNPREEVRRLYAFLEVSPDVLPSVVEKQVSVGIVPRFAFLEKLRLAVARGVYRRSPRIVNLVKRYGVTDLYRKINARKVGGRDLLGPGVRERLGEYYAPEMRRMEDLLRGQPGGGDRAE